MTYSGGWKRDRLESEDLGALLLKMGAMQTFRQSLELGRRGGGIMARLVHGRQADLIHVARESHSMRPLRGRFGEIGDMVGGAWWSRNSSRALTIVIKEG